MVKLGISGRWKPLPPFILPPDIQANFSNWVGVSLTDDDARGMEQATDRFIEARCIEAGYTDERTGKVVATDAEFGRTRRRLKRTLAALKAFKHFLDCDAHDLDIYAEAVRWCIAAQSKPSENIKMPNTEKLRLDVESWEILAYRALNALVRKHGLEPGKSQDPRGRPPERHLKIWITEMARKIDKLGGCTIENTRTGQRLAPGFGQLIRCLCNALRTLKVYLPTDRTIIKHAGDALLGRQGKSPRRALKTVSPRPRRRS